MSRFLFSINEKLSTGYSRFAATFCTEWTGTGLWTFSFIFCEWIRTKNHIILIKMVGRENWFVWWCGRIEENSSLGLTLFHGTVNACVAAPRAAYSYARGMKIGTKKLWLYPTPIFMCWSVWLESHATPCRTTHTYTYTILVCILYKLLCWYGVSTATHTHTHTHTDRHTHTDTITYTPLIHIELNGPTMPI